MIKTSTKVHGISMIEVWYADEPIKEDGIINYRQARFCPKKKYTTFETLITDLTQEEEEIIAKISKNGRYEIRRAQKEDVKTVIKTAKEITEEDIHEFVHFFTEFWASKGVIYTEGNRLEKEIKRYVEEDCFAITIALIVDKPCVYHTYILEEKTARLYQSASLYRVEEEIPKSLVGMANRFLHKEDMLTFKKMGIRQYDWGGAGTGKEVASITEFKKSFGGSPAVFYDFTRANGRKAKVIDVLSALKHFGKSK
ncbi:MAG: hypothetical protein PUB13_09300 [Lachnospiraceae bacterium]|nr:hypothetical protein [Lachnospiraceae bacterium]